MRHKVAMRRSRVVNGKYDMEDLMLALKEVKIKAEDMPLNMNQGHTATKQLKDKDKTPTFMVHVGYINENKTLCIPKEEDCRKATSEDNYLGYIKNILAGTEETPIDPKKLNNKGCVNPFSKDVWSFTMG